MYSKHRSCRGGEEGGSEEKIGSRSKKGEEEIRKASPRYGRIYPGSLDRTLLLTMLSVRARSYSNGY